MANTLFAIGDPHFNEDPTRNARLAAHAAMLNGLPGTAYPTEIGGTVAAPDLCIVLGDIINGSSHYPNAWNDAVGVYGHTGVEGILNYPNKWIHGNHDKNAAGLLSDLTTLNGGLNYTLDFGDAKLILIGHYPAADDLPWLANELAQLGRWDPVIIVTHFDFHMDWGFNPSEGWWTLAEGDAFYQTIKDNHVIAIIHGHRHPSSSTTWRNIHVHSPGVPYGAGWYGWGALAVKLDGYLLSIADYWAEAAPNGWDVWQNVWQGQIKSSMIPHGSIYRGRI